MRHLIIGHNIRMVGLLFLLGATFTLAAPWVYENIFIHEEDFIVNSESYTAVDFSEGLAVDKDVSLNMSFLNNDYVFSELKMYKLNFGGTIVSGDFVVKGQVYKDENGGFKEFKGKLFSDNITLNLNLFRPLGMAFRITKDELDIESLRIGKSYALKGKMSLIEPFESDFRLEIIRADIRDFARLTKVKDPNIAQGIVNGIFYIKGPMFSLLSDGVLKSRNGKVGPVGYSSAVMRFEGFGPIVSIVDSNLKQGDGTLTVEGYMDLRNIAKGNLFDGLRISSDMKTVVWDTWDITKRGTDELSMTKEITDKMRIGFKTVAREPLTTYYDRENPEEMSLEYKIGEENINLKLKENEEFFGIEHSVEF